MTAAFAEVTDAVKVTALPAVAVVLDATRAVVVDAGFDGGLVLEPVPEPPLQAESSMRIGRGSKKYANRSM